MGNYMGILIHGYRNIICMFIYMGNYNHNTVTK